VWQLRREESGFRLILSREIRSLHRNCAEHTCRRGNRHLVPYSLVIWSLCWANWTLRHGRKFYCDGRSIGESASPPWCRAPFGADDQILVTYLIITFFLLHVGRPLWREDGFVIYSAITYRSESRKTHNHMLLSHLRPIQPGRRGPSMYTPQEQGGPFKSQSQSQSQSQRYFTTDGQSISMSWCRAPFGTDDQILVTYLIITFFLLHVGRPLWREDGFVIYSAITYRSESRRTHNHMLLSNLRIIQPGRPGPSMYTPRNRAGQSKVKDTLRLTVSQSVCLGVEPALGLAARYYFLSEGFCLKVTVLTL
jgi:hypothetical protein